ncbi:MAG TPA: hypothetical protein VFM96_10970 [Gaiellaceae bacterium]|nr:hypothetical protein [Gaiellaceae bacterium]
MKHEEAFARLPDLLDDRDDAALLVHMRECGDCQRQLFLLGRVDRLLRDDAAASRPGRLPIRGLLAAATLAVAAAAAALMLALPQRGHGERFVLRTASGRSVAQAVMGHSDARNASLALTARGLPTGRGHMFVLWAGAAGSSMAVGRFMVNQTGDCRVHFNLPADHAWSRFWVASAERAAAVVAST